MDAGVSSGGNDDEEGGRTGSPCLLDVNEAVDVDAVGAGDICGRDICSPGGGDAAAAAAMAAVDILCCVA